MPGVECGSRGGPGFRLRANSLSPLLPPPPYGPLPLPYRPSDTHMVEEESIPSLQGGREWVSPGVRGEGSCRG